MGSYRRSNPQMAPFFTHHRPDHLPPHPLLPKHHLPRLHRTRPAICPDSLDHFLHHHWHRSLGTLGLVRARGKPIYPPPRLGPVGSVTRTTAGNIPRNRIDHPHRRTTDRLGSRLSRLSSPARGGPPRPLLPRRPCPARRTTRAHHLRRIQPRPAHRPTSHDNRHRISLRPLRRSRRRRRISLQHLLDRHAQSNVRESVECQTRYARLLHQPGICPTPHRPTPPRAPRSPSRHPPRRPRSGIDYFAQSLPRFFPRPPTQTR